MLFSYHYKKIFKIDFLTFNVAGDMLFVGGGIEYYLINRIVKFLQ